MNDLTRMELVEQLSAFERRVAERFDLLERLIALGFDDTGDRVDVGLARLVERLASPRRRDQMGRADAGAAPGPPA